VDGADATVLVVRPRAQAAAWVAELAALGTPARALPLIEILPAPVPAQVEQAFAQAEACAAGAVFMFVSPNAVQGFFDAVAAGRGVAAQTLAWPAQARAAATGPGTVAALRDCGVPADAIVAPDPAAQQFDSESLWSVIADWPWAGRPVWIVRGNGGRDWLGRQLRDAGADVRFVQSYGRAAPVLSADEQALLAAALAAPARWIWMFSSSEAIDHLQALGPGAQWAAGRALASHPRIAERARALGFGSVTLVAPAAAAVSAAVASAHRPA
jgi:uroporphyrinogen-III synthase